VAAVANYKPCVFTEEQNTWINFNVILGFTRTYFKLFPLFSTLYLPPSFFLFHSSATLGPFHSSTISGILCSLLIGICTMSFSSKLLLHNSRFSD
jgi:hypothetical protein